MSFILEGVFHASNFIGLIPSCSVHQMLPIFSGVICCERLYQSWRKEKQSRCLVFSFSTKCEIRHFQVVVMYWRQRNVQKSVMHVQSCCFANDFMRTSCFFFAIVFDVTMVISLVHFSKTGKFWSSKANWRLCFSLPSTVLMGLLETKLYFNEFKRSGLWFRIGWFQSFLCVLVSRFVACDRYDIMIDGSEKCRCEGGFWT